METLASLAGLVGLGGLAGGVLALYLAGRRFATELSELAQALDDTLRDPRRTDLRRLLDEVRQASEELQSFLGTLRRVFRIRA